VKLRGLAARVPGSDPGVPLAVGRRLLVGHRPPSRRTAHLDLRAASALVLGLGATALAVRAVLGRRAPRALGLV
jgi:hypothetical protein